MTAIISLGRYGDCINCLPCVREIARREGGKCAVVVSREFADVLAGCSYVEPVVCTGHFTDIVPAIEMAKERFERVLCAKVSERSIEAQRRRFQSFTEQQWSQLGMHNDWFRLPLVFDRRDKEREAALLKQHTNGKPFMLYNFGGKSSPVPNGEQWLERHRHLFACQHFVNLADIKAHRIYDLLGLFDAAEGLITGDTATLHLAAASAVPVVNLIQCRPTLWHGSRPRNNSVCEIRYSDMDRILTAADFRFTPRRYMADRPMNLTTKTPRHEDYGKPE